ncbi:MAG: rod-binding protein [Alphaproteobacteria bacterium]|nr:rod-binding protein [Alphaproteobacteria bacterium]
MQDALIQSALVGQPGPAVPKAPRDASLEKVRAAAVEFEAVFLAQMLRPMFDGVGTDGPFGGGQAEAINRDMLVDEYGKALAQRGGIGLADSVLAEMLKMQEASR